jgi:monothiol glutaredoxin
LVIKNPNEPKAVKQISKEELEQGIEQGLYKHIYDVRSEQQFSQQSIADSKRLDKEQMKQIEKLAKDTPLVFVCHIGSSSKGACEFYRKKGHTNVSNLIGGVSNWFN